MNIKQDVFTGKMSFYCRYCPRHVEFDASELVVGSFDYCGCGAAEITLTLNQVNSHRKAARLPELKE